MFGQTFANMADWLPHRMGFVKYLEKSDGYLAPDQGSFDHKVETGPEHVFC